MDSTNRGPDAALRTPGKSNIGSAPGSSNPHTTPASASFHAEAGGFPLLTSCLGLQGHLAMLAAGPPEATGWVGG